MKTMLTPFILLIFLISIPLFAQNQGSTPCSDEAVSQFDFWLGKWQLTWQGGQAGTPEGQVGKATNHLTKIMGGCVIKENFATADGSYLGQSWSVYNPNTKLWQQTWVDNSGSYLLFTGKFENGMMELRSTPRTVNGQQVISRMVFKNITENSIDWDWQRSSDEGETWQDVWNITYKRVE